MRIESEEWENPVIQFEYPSFLGSRDVVSNPVMMMIYFMESACNIIDMIFVAR